jgi:RES domain-containing protein
VLTAITIQDPAGVYVVDPATFPNSNWLMPGMPSAGQQNWGDGLLAAHAFVLIPSVVSVHSWNLAFDGTHAARGNSSVQEPFALDPRLHPPHAS